MYLLEIDNVFKTYKSNEKTDEYVLKGINLKFDNRGLTSIVGKSGCGKSTLLNLIGGLDKPTLGTIRINNQDINNKKSKTNEIISFVFQNYFLLEDQSALMNVMLPLLIRGYKKKEAKNNAKETLDKVGITNFDQLTKTMSGGERQRVAIARALITDPQILICDEPTGALDSGNSVKVMEILKSQSKNRLVILVSHNLQLVKNYSDRIIKLSDGNVVADSIITPKESVTYKRKKHKKSFNKWIDYFSIFNFKKRKEKTLFSIAAMSVAFTFLLVTFGFIQGKENSINTMTSKQLDYGVGTLSIEEKISSGSLLSLTKTIRPDMEEILSNDSINKNYYICDNFDAIFMSKPRLKFENVELDDVEFRPIYSFKNSSLNCCELIKGNVPNNDSLKYVLLNDSAYNVLCNLCTGDIVGATFHISYIVDTYYVDEDETIIEDPFIFEYEFIVSGVVEEMSYMNTPKAYYSYNGLSQFLEETYLEKLSTYFNKSISWKDRIRECKNNTTLSSYSLRLFPKRDYEEIDFKTINEKLSFLSQSILIKESLVNFMSVIEYGLDAFLIIVILGTVMILGLISFSNYESDHKQSAILTVNGARHSEIEDIYLGENIICLIISLFIGIIMFFAFMYLINSVVISYVGLADIIVFPLYLLNIEFGFPITLVVLSLLTTIIFTIIPVGISKKIPIIKELRAQ